MAQQKIRARYTNGVFVPQEPVSLSEGCEVSVVGDDERPQSGGRSGAAAVLEIVAAMRRERPSETLEPMPVDSARRHRELLYGSGEDAE